MKGAPLWRGLWIALAIAMVGAALWRGQGSRVDRKETLQANAAGERVAPAQDVHFIVQVSPGIACVRLFDATAAAPAWEQKWESAQEWRGKWSVLPSVVGVQVEVEPTARAQRVFVKMTIEPDGGESITRVFDGIGDLDERWELP